MNPVKPSFSDLQISKSSNFYPFSMKRIILCLILPFSCITLTYAQQATSGIRLLTYAGAGLFLPSSTMKTNSMIGNGVNFSFVDRIDAVNTVSQAKYNFRDLLGSDQIYFYRLKIVEQTGNSSYSYIIRVTSHGKHLFCLHIRTRQKILFYSITNPLTRGLTS